jgi:hypothetical protein
MYAFQKTEKDSSKEPYLNIARDLITGVIDVDRVSYLLHDSNRTGVPYGGAIDVQVLVEALTIRWNPSDPDDVDSNGLALEEMGISAAEAVLMAVHWMYRNVYWRHTNRAFMAAIKFVMRHLLCSDITWFDTYWEYSLNRTDWECLKVLRRKFDVFRNAQVAAQQWVNPLASLADFGRIGYRRVCTIRYGGTSDSNYMRLGKWLADRVWGRNIPIQEELIASAEGCSSANIQVEDEVYKRLTHGITPDREEQLIASIEKTCIPLGVDVKKGDILIDIPLKKRFRERDGGETAGEWGAKRSRLWICRRNSVTKMFEGWGSLESYSPIAEKLAELEDYSGRKIRVFFSRALLDRMEEKRRACLPTLARDLFDSINQATEKWSRLY